MTSLKICQIGDFLGVPLPEEVLSRLNVTEGDTLHLTELPDGSIRVTSDAPDFEGQMQVAQEGMDKYRNALRELAK